MKSITTILAALAVGTTLSIAADEKPAAPAKPEAAKPAAGAEKPKPDPAAAFAKKDTNNDKSLSLDEYKAGAKDPAKAEEAFKKKDKNADGKLTLEEFSAAGGKKK